MYKARIVKQIHAYDADIGRIVTVLSPTIPNDQSQNDPMFGYKTKILEIPIAIQEGYLWHPQGAFRPLLSEYVKLCQ